jgi:aspartyl aminopeptidase
MKKAKELMQELSYKRKNFWQEAAAEEKKAALDFCEGYKTFLDKAKTEREAINFYGKQLTERGYANIDAAATGKKVYRLSRGKNAAIALIGKKPISEGVNLIVSHVDAPRVDIKQNPLEETNTSLAIMKTHYYGGVKKYQWMSTPLAIHGVFVKRNGETVTVSLGEDENDPVFVMPDLLPHLARKIQSPKKIGEAVAAANMKLIFSAMPFLDEEDAEVKNAIKLNALYLLNEKYGIIEQDFLSAELQLVPAGKARDCGMDRSFVLGYGQDDRVCAYTSAEAIYALENEDLEKTAIVYMADKEEIGSDSNTGAKSNFIIDFLADLLAHNKEQNDSNTLRKTLIRSQIISADVNAGINPNYPGVHEKENAVHMGFGVAVAKYTGSGGKGGSNDANAEFNAKIYNVYDQEKVFWQIGALGKVDEGGGGTIAKFMAEYGAEVIDCGPGILGMHSLYELSSKADVYSAYRAYKAFFQKA